MYTLRATSPVVNRAVSDRPTAVARKTGSLALESDAWHLRTDVCTPVGVLGDLVVPDSIVAIGVAPIIIRGPRDPTERSHRDLVDHRLTDGEDGRIRQIVREHQSACVRYHTLRTRRSGPELLFDLSPIVDRDVPVDLSHDPTDRREADPTTEFPARVRADPRRAGFMDGGARLLLRDRPRECLEKGLD